MSGGVMSGAAIWEWDKTNADCDRQYRVAGRQVSRLDTKVHRPGPI